MGRRPNSEANFAYRDQNWLYLAYVEEGRTCQGIAAELGSKPSTISKWLRIHGIEVNEHPLKRPTEFFENRDWLFDAYINQGRSLRDIGIDAGRSSNTIRAWMKRFGIERRERVDALNLKVRVNHFPIEFFRHWSPKLAYVAGFAMADGCVQRGLLQLFSTDRCLLEVIAKAIGLDGNIYEHKKGKENWKTGYLLKFAHPEMNAILSQYGLVPRKSHIAKMPNVPSEFLGHYARGVFDGDGCVWWSNRKTTVPHLGIDFCSASPQFLEALETTLGNTGLSRRGLDTRSYRTASYLRYVTDADVLSLYKMMYEDAGDLFLPRKRERFFEYFRSVDKNLCAPPSMFRMPMEMRHEIVSLLDHDCAYPAQHMEMAA